LPACPSTVITQNQVHRNGSVTFDCEVAIKVVPEHADFDARFDFMQEINFMKARNCLLEFRCNREIRRISVITATWCHWSRVSPSTSRLLFLQNSAKMAIYYIYYDARKRRF
jgi:hypothetical protein